MSELEVPNRRYFKTPATAPGPAGPEMARAFLQIRNNPLQFLHDSWNKYGDVVQFPIPSPPSYLVNDPAAIRRVLVEVPRNYSKKTIQYRSLSLVTGQGLLVADHDVWRTQRMLVQPAFHHATLSRLAKYVHDVTDQLTQEWLSLPSESVIDIDAAMMEGALEVVGHALFGTNLSDDAAELTSATLAALDVVIARARVPISPPGWLPTPSNRRLASALSALDGAVAHMMTSERSHTDDMLGLLLNARDDDGQSLDANGVRDQIVTFIVAGHETVASALTWTWALLAQHGEVQAELHAELDAVLNGRAPEFDDIAALPFTRAVFDEALRLYPPAWLISRTALAADELGGREIPEGALIIMSPYLLHRHPDIWTDPERFDPHREFDRTNFIPFGNGLRLCIGRDFAYVEAILMLASLAQRFVVSYPDGESAPDAVPLVTMRPEHGLVVRVSPRG